VTPDSPDCIALLGLGLIGGSLGLALRTRFPGVEVVGADPAPGVAEAALARGALSRTAATPALAVRGADLVVLAMPVGRVPEVLHQIGPALRPGALVTDTGSTKGGARDAARSLPSGVRFVGGHPMAGAERGGIENADPLLFENAVYVLCPPDGVAPSALGTYAPDALWLTTAVGARAVAMDADRHDTVVAAVSHLPQVLAVALVEHAMETGADALPLAAGGFRDMTRIASSPFGLWAEILDANRAAVATSLGAFAERLLDMQTRLAGGALANSFERAAATRNAIPTSSKGFFAPLADIVVWAEDRPGYLHRLTGVLAEAGLNVKDIELMRIREGGAFRLGLADAADAERAIDVLTLAGYRAQRR
jgi:prephenate dehydrogenase